MSLEPVSKGDYGKTKTFSQKSFQTAKSLWTNESKVISEKQKNGDCPKKSLNPSPCKQDASLKLRAKTNVKEIFCLRVVNPFCTLLSNLVLRNFIGWIDITKQLNC